MANTIKIKQSAVASNVPVTLAQGELALNTADKKLFSFDGTSIFELAPAQDLSGYSLPSHNHDADYSALGPTHVISTLTRDGSVNPGIDTYLMYKWWDASFTNTDVGTTPTNYCHIANLGGYASKGLQFAASYGGTNDGFYMRRGSDNAASELGADVWQSWKQIMSKELADTLYSLTGHGHVGDYISQSGGTYPGLAPSGSEAGWLRVPASGLLPQVSGGASSSLGTATWKFNAIHGVNIYDNGTLLSSKYLQLAGGTLTGKLNIVAAGGSEMLLLKDSGGAGAASNPYIGFDDSAGVRQGYVGFGSGSTQDLYVNADIGDVRIVAGGGDIFLQDTVHCSAHLRPATNNASDLGTSSAKWNQGFIHQIELGGLTDTTLTRGAAGQLDVENKPVYAQSSTAYASAKITFSTSAASGGADGDIWFQYV